MADWINWNGGDHPDLPPMTPMWVEYRGEQGHKGVRIPFGPAIRFDWSHDGGPDDIVAYQIFETASANTSIKEMPPQ
jgi:hypothetical protein